MSAIRIALFTHFFLSSLILVALWLCTEKGSRWRKVGVALALVEFLLTITFHLTKANLPLEQFGTALKAFNAYYVIAIVFLFWLTIAYLAIEVAKLIGIIKEKKQRKRWRATAFVAMIPITTLLCLWGSHNTYYPIVTRYDIELQGEKEEHLKLVFLADTHIGEIIGEEQIAHLAELVHAEQPDYILHGGDIIDYLLEFAQNPSIEQTLDALHPQKERIIYILGNHEYYGQEAEKEAWIRERGTLLKDSVMPLTEQVWLIGRDDKMNKDRKELSELVAQLPPSSIKLLMDHQPSEPEVVRANGIDLSLHGHTHQGQFIPFSWLIELYFERAYGLYKKNAHTWHLITSGYGVSTASFRIGTHSEITVINLHIAPTNV